MTWRICSSVFTQSTDLISMIFLSFGKQDVKCANWIKNNFKISVKCPKQEVISSDMCSKPISWCVNSSTAAVQGVQIIKALKVEDSHRIKTTIRPLQLWQIAGHSPEILAGQISLVGVKWFLIIVWQPWISYIRAIFHMNQYCCCGLWNKFLQWHNDSLQIDSAVIRYTLFQQPVFIMHPEPCRNPDFLQVITLPPATQTWWWCHGLMKADRCFHFFLSDINTQLRSDAPLTS